MTPRPDDMARARIDTVIFDLGGVLASNGRPADIGRNFPDHDPVALRAAIMGPYDRDTDHPWHRLERGEIDFDTYRRENAPNMAAAGVKRPPTPPHEQVSEASGGGSRPRFDFEVNQAVLDLVYELRDAGLRLGVLTNNIAEFRPLWHPLLPFDELFDDVVDSSAVALRKPNPAVYQLALSRLGSQAERTAFLDDVESNLVPARALGMTAILVEDDPTSAIAALRSITGVGGPGRATD